MTLDELAAAARVIWPKKRLWTEVRVDSNGFATATISFHERGAASLSIISGSGKTAEQAITQLARRLEAVPSKRGAR